MNSSEFTWFLHDVATPLTTAEGVLAYVLHHFPTPTGPLAQSFALLDTSLSCIQHVRAMVTEERLPHHQKQQLSCSLLSQIMAVSQTLRPLIEQYGVCFTFHPPSESIQVVGQTTYIRRVLQNLLLNALEAVVKSPANHPKSIAINVTHTASFVCVVIDDTGPGFLPKKRQAARPGHGHGLKATRHLLKHKLHGRLQFSINTQGGTRATCWFLSGKMVYCNPVPKDSVQKNTDSL